MNNESYHKYFFINEEDRSWGIHLLDCGVNSILQGNSKGPLDHPKAYSFGWDKGRILQEYQLIYILSGTGQFESRCCEEVIIRAGDLIMLHPDTWHRYKADNFSYWNTVWIGFDGALCRKLVPTLGISEERPILSIGYDQNLLEIFNSIIDISKSEFSGFQHVAAGEILKSLGWIKALLKKTNFNKNGIDSMMIQAKSMLRDYEKFDRIELVANNLNMGYSKFRKIFKSYTGISPGQFRLHYLMKKAEFLLQENRLSIQEISDLLGFETTQYFSRVFKTKTGKTPGEFRSMNQFSYSR